MKKTSVLIFSSILLLTSCNDIYKRYDKDSFLPLYTWDSSKGIIFKPQIDDITGSYKLVLGIRHVYGFRLATLKVKIQTLSPSGKQTEKLYEIKIKDANGEYLSNCSGDLCDLETVVENNVKFEEIGDYTFSVTHQSQDKKIVGIMEVGLIIDESKIKNG